MSRETEIRFGPYVFSNDTLELKKDGRGVPLRPQPARALRYLLARPGSVVTRDELYSLLWPDTIVDFDKSLTFVVLQLRRALDDDAAQPTFIETLPRIGYRFRFPVGAPAAPARPRWWNAAGAFVVLVGASLVASQLPSTTPSPAPDADYLKGRYLLERGDRDALDRSVAFLERAVERDARLADAWAALAGAHLRYALGGDPDAADAARRAVETALDIDPSHAEALVRLGDIRSVLDWDWEGSRDAYEKAIRSEPSHAEAYHHLSTYYVLHGDLDEAIDLIERALELEPVSMTLLIDAGWKYLAASRFDAAVAACEKTLELDPHQTHARECLVYAHAWAGRRDDALAEAAVLLRDMGAGDAPPTSVAAFESRRLELWRNTSRRSAVDLALTYASLGETDEALAALDRALEARAPQLVLRIRDPRLRALERTPRFNAILAELRL